LNFRGEYEAAREWLARLFEDIETFGLEFVLPFAYWALAQSALGARRFGEAERALQMIEDAAVRTHDRQHEMNAAVLRGRLFLQTGDADAAVRSLRADPEFAAIPSWRAEFFATRALALACQGHAKAALGDAGVAEALTAALDVELLVRAARTIAMGATDEGCAGLISRANRTWVWDPVICALRSSSDLASSAAANPVTRDSLASLYERTGDSSLAKKAGLRTRATRAPDAILTSRELEVLGLIARGFKNKDISRALYIADSTTKVHVRHILEKLGVRTRAEAVARYQMLRDPGD
jgi:ATP/maltotriose-dependent transcriptional regulator MalT